MSDCTGYEPAVGAALVDFWTRCKELGVVEQLHVRAATPMPQMRATTASLLTKLPLRMFDTRESALEYIATRRAGG
jgi:hypothetical protein